ncbi:MAG: hypothetical protein RLZ83_1047 [Pseudomonadota bacterium]
MSDESIHLHLARLAAAALTPAGAGADPDPAETAEWREALQSLLREAGPARVRQIMDMLGAMARDPAVGWQPAAGSPYVNTIPADRQPPFPGDLALEERLASIMRWNALAMVVRANAAHGELAATSPAMRARPISSRWASTISSAPPGPTRRAVSTRAIWCSSSRTRPPASTRAPSSRAG